MKKYKTYLKLGLGSLFNILIYRLQIKSGYFKKRLPINPFKQGGHAGPPLRHFSELNLFFAEGQDIKSIWEYSRFYWFPELAKQGQVQELEKKINQWLEENPWNAGYNWACAQEASIRLINFILGLDIVSPKKPGVGANLVFALSARGDFIEKHCERIIPVMRYADAQKNNHATSEAAGLFIAGCYLGGADFVSPLAGETGQKNNYFFGQRGGSFKKYLSIGRKYLERQMKRLVMSDGTFAQYSVTYHRLVLDTISLCEIFRKRANQPQFSEIFYLNYQKLFLWLYQITDPISGDAPNLGANDGTNLFKLDSLDYRDFRPSLQLASVLINQKKCFEPGPWDECLSWLDLKEKYSVEKIEKKSKEFKEGGFVSLVWNADSSLPLRERQDKKSQDFLDREGSHTHCLLRYANFKFRPSQADCFHLDLFHRGVNILRDGGSYSYNTTPEKMKYYSGTASHNTIMFDGHDQMPKISRFLFGDWLKTKISPSLSLSSAFGPVSPARGETKSDPAQNVWTWSGEYQDYLGCRHKRSLEINESLKTIWVRDEISNFKNSAVLKWRLAPELNWVINKNRCESELASLEIWVDGQPVFLELSEEKESRYYHHESNIPALQIYLKAPTRYIQTKLVLN